MSEMTQLLADTADRLFSAHVDQTVMDAAEAGAFPQALWEAFKESGLPELLTPEGGGAVEDAVAVSRAAGFHAAPGPLIEAMAANAIVAHWLGEPSSCGPKALAFVDDAINVAWAGDLPTVLVSRDGAGMRIALATPDDLVLERPRRRLCEPCYQLTRTHNLDWRTVDGDYEDALQLASVLRAAQMTGALEWCLERTIAYALERKQFGREIGKFQAVQQHLAQFAAEVVAAGAAVDAAAARMSVGSRSIMVPAMRSRLGDAVDTSVWLSHQVHGAIGFSREYLLNYRTRRLMNWRDCFGTTERWRRSLSEPFVGLAHDRVWPALSEV